MIKRRFDSARSAAVVGAIGLALVSIISLLALLAADWDATVFVGFGEDALPTRQYAEARLGDVILRPSQGHDGKYFFVQANDPLLLNPAENAEALDLPVYRSQRMLYPLLAGGLGLFSPGVTVWGLLLVSLLSLGAGTFVSAQLAVHLGGSPWWGLAFAFNIGFLYALTSDVSDVLAAALAMWAVLSIYQSRTSVGVAALTAAALSREVMILCAFGMAAYLWFEHRRREALAVLLIPSAFLLSWVGYIYLRLGPDPWGARALGAPFVGLFKALGDWVNSPASLGAGICVVLLLVLLAVDWWRFRTLLDWAFVGFVPLAVILTDKVWTKIFDFSRAVAPALTAAVLAVLVDHKLERGIGVRSPSGAT